MKYYPVMLHMEGMRVTVIGGGKVAGRKIKDLLEAGASITLIAPELGIDLAAYQEEYPGKITYLKRAYCEGDARNARLVFCATNDPVVNERVYREAKQENVFINAVDDTPHCTFIVPSSFSRGELIVAVSTSGKAPALAARVRRAIEATIPDNIDAIITKVASVRQMIYHDPVFRHLSRSEHAGLSKKITDPAIVERLMVMDTPEKIREYLNTLLEFEQ